VQPENELFTGTDLAVVWVLADGCHEDLSLVRPGRDVTVAVIAYPDRQCVLQGGNAGQIRP
jgi:multidrug resistance efflux pump